jgi:hypothetical protein
MEVPNTSTCPVCLLRIRVDFVNTHIASHSKEEVVAALFRQTPMMPPSMGPPSTSLSTVLARPPPPGAAPVGTLPTPSPYPGLHFMASAGDMSSTPLLMPSMMGMSMVMSPVLIPQQNGPPLIINVPSYVYPNMLNQTSASASSTSAAPPTPTFPTAPLLLPTTSIASSSQTALPKPVPFPPSSTMTMSPATSSSTAKYHSVIPPTTIVSSHIRDLEVDDESSNSNVSMEIIEQQQPWSPVPGPSKPAESKPQPSPSKGFTQYAPDSPYPAASLTFPSSILSSVQESRSRSTSPIASVEEETVVKKENVCTVSTVSDLLNAQMLLKSDDDIQIVVPNELLETIEFKAFISNLNLPFGHQLHNANSVPPNTPITTRPPSVVHSLAGSDILDDESPIAASPQPSTSRSMSHESSPMRLTLDSDEEVNIIKISIITFEKLISNIIFRRRTMTISACKIWWPWKQWRMMMTLKKSSKQMTNISR